MAAELLKLIQAFFDGVHFDEHTLLIFCLGMIFGMIVGAGLGRGYHRQLYGAIRRRYW